MRAANVRTIKATDAERAAYAATSPVYPQWGWVLKNGARFVVEDLRGSWSKGDPVFEIIAPDGHIFMSDCCHTLLCDNLADVRDRMSYATAERCDCDECAAYWEAATPAPVTLGARLMPGCTCGAAARGDFERCTCD